MTYKIFLVPLLAAALVLSIFLWHDTNGPSGTQAPPPPSAHEAAPVAIRIGYLHPDSAIANSIDVRHFYGQHLTELAKYLDWTYELVEIPPQEAVECLKRHDVDLLLPMEVNPQRQGELVYSKHAFFLDTLALYTREDEERFHSHDISKLDGASVGLYENRLINDTFLDFCRENRIHPQFHTYANQDEVLNALRTKQIDLVLDSATNITDEESFLMAFDLLPTNIAGLKEKQHLIEDLDRAAKLLQRENPEYTRLLEDKFRAHMRPLITTYTPEESSFISRSKPLKVAFFGEAPPYVEYTTSMDDVQGIYPDLFRQLERNSGLSFDFLHYSTYDDAVKALKEGQADLIIDTHSAHIKNYSSFAYTNHLFLQEMTFIGPTSADFTKFASEPHTLALVKSQSPSGLVYLQNELIGWEFRLYDDISDCLEAVKRGEADYTLIDILRLQADRTLLMYPTLMTVPTSYMNIPVCIVISRHLPPILKTVLNKSILKFTTGQVDKLVRARSLNTHPSFSLYYLFTHYPLQSGLSVGFLLLLITTLIFSIHHNRDEKRQRLILTQTNQELEDTLQELWKAEKSRDEYKEQAETDALTGVLNKAAMEKYVKKTLASLTSSEKVSDAFIIADLDHFKEANDTQGHKYGDDILRDFAHSLIRLTRHRDIVGRFGGDEFVLYLRNIPEPALHAFAQRLMTAAHNLDPVQKPPLSASIGIALINQPGLSYEEVFHKADRALYDVKESGRDGYKIYEN